MPTTQLVFVFDPTSQESAAFTKTLRAFAGQHKREVNVEVICLGEDAVSEAAARGFAALRSLRPSDALEFAGAIHEAHLERHESLGDARTYRTIAREAALDEAEVAHRFASLEFAAAAADDVARAHALGVSAAPAVLLRSAARYERVPTVSGEELARVSLGV